MFDWLDSLDVYIQPSLVEAMPRALIEAMSRGLPSLGSKVGDIPELLTPSFVFSRGDVDAIARKLRSLTFKILGRAAIRNFKYAQRFEKYLLEQTRYELYSAFTSEVKE